MTDGSRGLQLCDDGGKPKCGGGNPWPKKLKKDIIIDTDEKFPLLKLVDDLEVGVTAMYHGRQMSEEMNEPGTEYAQSKSDRPEEEQSLFALVGDQSAQTTKQRLSVNMMMGKPELGKFLRDIEHSAPEGLRNVVSSARAMGRPVGAGIPFHRGSIDLKLDRVVYPLLTGDSEKPPEFRVKLMSETHAKPDRGPYGPDELVIPKDIGRIVVKGPNARGE